MLTAKNIIEMEANIIHHTVPRKRNNTLKIDKLSPTDSMASSLASRRASVPMEIIIGSDGRPVFNATSSPTTAGSPIFSDQKVTRQLKKDGSLSRENSKKSVKKTLKKSKTLRDKSMSVEDRESPMTDDSMPLAGSMATCSISSISAQKEKSIELPKTEFVEYTITRKAEVQVRNFECQTDF